MAHARINDKQGGGQTLKIHRQAPHPFAAGPLLDVEHAAQERRIVVLDTGRQAHQARFEVARQVRAFRGRGGWPPQLRSHLGFDSGEEGHRHRGAGAEATAPRRIAGEGHLDRRQVQCFRDHADQSAFGLRQESGGGGGFDGLRALGNPVEMVVGAAEPDGDGEVERDIDRPGSWMQEPERPDVQRTAAEIGPAPGAGSDHEASPER